MNTVVIYKSRTGFTKRYAEWIGAELQCKTADYSDIDSLQPDSFGLIVYGARVHAGRIDSLEKMKKLAADKKCDLIVFATGATPCAERGVIEKLMSNNFPDSTIAHFYMQSGLCYEKMGFADKAIMKALAKVLSGKENKTDAENGTASAIKSSYDISSKEYIAPLIEYVKKKYGEA